ncbi:hypothetical protein [Colwellia sp. RSH04]|uniref:hypothetical protein n=1 Tax=Colwellia sp. RSH04 TaxID=2305464 RepID=UPI000E573160|nr:hypothetical protein [Colwellia sp. RSH04]RHW75552.1 hypothetical protein D1094_12595 [Colwellia sp. RSH04]
MNNSFKKIESQQGVVLVVSLVFLVALTAVASTLMLNSTTDIKMSGASEDKVVATEEALSAMDEVIFRQINPAAGGANSFTVPIVKLKGKELSLLGSVITTKKHITKADLGLVNNKYTIAIPCPHSMQGSSVGTINCNVLRVKLNKTYGRKNTSIVAVEAGIAQPIL